MFTIFDAELDAFARKVVDEQRSFDEGRWDTGRLRSHQWQGLRDTLRFVKDNSKFYSKQLALVSHAQIGDMDVEEFTRSVPFTGKQDLRDFPESMLSKPLSQSWVYYETTGTTGMATPCPRDNRDSISNNAALTVCYQSVFEQHGTEQAVAILGPTELHSTGDTFGDVCRNLGYPVVKMWPYSPLVGFSRALRLLRDLRITTVFCTPGMAITLAKEALAADINPVTEFGVRCLMLVGELVTPGLLKTIENIWGARAYNCMLASQEASILAAVYADGGLRSVPLNVYYEIVDPATGMPIAADGYGQREGELVITHLYQGSKPLVRYRTGDLVRFGPADLTRPYPSEAVIPLGRVRDRISLNGNHVTAFDLENQVLSHAAGCLDYHITLDRESEADFITVNFEMLPGRTIDSREISQALSGIFGCKVSARSSALGPITSTGAMVSWKAARLQDLRSGSDHEFQAAMSIAEKRGSR
jgi:phenylacetate-coenzyme A ligase PaaK-like adenylate-forming protein